MFLIGLATLAAEQLQTRLAPDVCLAVRATVAGLDLLPGSCLQLFVWHQVLKQRPDRAGEQHLDRLILGFLLEVLTGEFLRSGNFLIPRLAGGYQGSESVDPGQAAGFTDERLGGSFEVASRNGVVAHFLADLFPAGSAGAAGHQADLFHLRGPLLVVVATAARFPMAVLPVVDHFVDDGLQDLQQVVPGKVGRVHCDLMDHLACRIGPAVGREIPHQVLLALYGQQAGGKPAGEQRRIEVVVGRFQIAIKTVCWGFHRKLYRTIQIICGKIQLINGGVGECGRYQEPGWA
jgi:hypothetical protein